MAARERYTETGRQRQQRRQRPEGATTGGGRGEQGRGEGGEWASLVTSKRTGGRWRARQSRGRRAANRCCGDGRAGGGHRHGGKGKRGSKHGGGGKGKGRYAMVTATSQKSTQRQKEGQPAPIRPPPPRPPPKKTPVSPLVGACARQSVPRTPLPRAAEAAPTHGHPACTPSPPSRTASFPSTPRHPPSPSSPLDSQGAITPGRSATPPPLPPKAQNPASIALAQPPPQRSGCTARHPTHGARPTTRGTH